MTTILSTIKKGSARLAPAFAGLLLAAAPAAAQTYTVTDLGTLGPNSLGNYSAAFCINASGQVAMATLSTPA